MNSLRKAALGAVLMGGALAGGALGASFVSGAASAQTNTNPSAPAAPTDPAATAPHDRSQGGHTANGISETLLTGDTATKATAAAKAAVPDGTIDRVENDAEGATYEAHMTKSDGSHVTVKLNADFSVAGIEQGN